jgi:hypothetical protein
MGEETQELRIYELIKMPFRHKIYLHIKYVSL